jgi:putative ABC transport system permease protein
MSYALVIGLAGGLLGGVLGVALARPFTNMYQMYFNMPDLSSGFSPAAIIEGVLLGLVFALFAGYRGCRKVLTLQPAEAMRPNAPIAGKAVLLEKIEFFWNMLTVQGKMAVRNMFRHKGRSAFIIVGIMFAFALLGSCWSMWELSEQMLFDQYEKVEVYDVKISLNRPVDQDSVERELKSFPGVKRLESKAEIPATLKYKWNKKDVVILGLPADSELHRISDDDGNRLFTTPYGIMLSNRLAQLLGAEVGSSIIFESMMAKDPDFRYELEVTAIVPQYMGVNAYMDLEYLQSVLNQGEIVTTLMLSMDQEKVTDLRTEYHNSVGISGIEDRNKMLMQLKELMATYSATIYIMLLIGIIVGFAIIYNSSVITVSERSRELASMMVLGMTSKEVLSVVTFEQWFLSIFGMLAGIPLTKLLLVALAQSLSNDVYSMPSSFGSMTLIVGFVITVASIWIAQRAAASKIKALHIADVLKAGE